MRPSIIVSQRLRSLHANLQEQGGPVPAAQEQTCTRIAVHKCAPFQSESMPKAEPHPEDELLPGLAAAASRLQA